MVSTSMLRVSYPELVLNRTLPKCDFSSALPFVMLAGGPSYPKGRVTLRVHPKVHQPFRALAAVFLHHGYAFEETAGGTLSCRAITGGTDTSPHAHGVALDINPSRNRYIHTKLGGLIQWGRQTDLPPELIQDIEAIRLTNGRKAFEWGGRWFNIKDPMHFGIAVLQTDLAPVDLTTLPVGAWSNYLAFEAGIQQGEQDMSVREFVEGMKKHPQRIDQLVDAGLIGPPGAGTKAHWRGLLEQNLNDPTVFGHWLNFCNALTVASAVNTARAARVTVSPDTNMAVAGAIATALGKASVEVKFT